MRHVPYEVHEVIVTAPFAPVGVVLPLDTPSGVAAMTTHHGDYGRLGEGDAAILEWCRVNDRVHAGSSWEVYGLCHADSEQLRTDLYYLCCTQTMWTPSHNRRTAARLVCVLSLLAVSANLGAQAVSAGSMDSMR